jgi:flagellar biosynthesis protein FliR
VSTEVILVSDKLFELSLTVLTIAVVLWIILGIVFKVMGWLPVVLIGIVVEIVGGGFLLHRWGKSYIEKE